MNKDQYVIHVQMRKLRGINLTHSGKIAMCKEWIEKNNKKIEILQKEFEDLE